MSKIRSDMDFASSKSSEVAKALNPFSIIVAVVLVVTFSLLWMLGVINWWMAISGYVLSVLIAAAFKIADQWEKAVVLRLSAPLSDAIGPENTPS
jgi:glucan phosphoethanolaminetransferase (alkaline phosphatase superfamily)